MASLKEAAKQIFHDTLAAIDIPAALRRKLDRTGSQIRCGGQTIDLATFEVILVLSVGKAACATARGLLDALAPDFTATGILVAPAVPPADLPNFVRFVGGHPVPNEDSLNAGSVALELLRNCNERSLIFFLLSGGGSALMEAPLYEDVALEDVQALNRVLVTCGAPIDEVNAVRKHLSAIKGGRLAAAAPAAMKITLGVSDVPQGRESALASGPTLPDPTTCDDVYRVVEKYRILDNLPAPIRARIAARELEETPKEGHPAFARAHFELLLGVNDLFAAARTAAEAQGFTVTCDNASDDWPLAKAADHLLKTLTHLKKQNDGARVCVIADGEVSSPVTGPGVGGRNSAFVLNCVEKIAGRSVAVLSAGTDGIDGNSPAAGAVADGLTHGRSIMSGLDYTEFFRRSDAYSFFRLLDDAIETGPTGNNLRDLRILLAE
ncbi:MAG: glycerate kinase type-2 family protein [Candidatus Acidiferrales bacterium]